jgi:hypothetical protein
MATAKKVSKAPAKVVSSKTVKTAAPTKAKGAKKK